MLTKYIPGLTAISPTMIQECMMSQYEQIHSRQLMQYEGHKNWKALHKVRQVYGTEILHTLWPVKYCK